MLNSTGKIQNLKFAIFGPQSMSCSLLASACFDLTAKLPVEAEIIWIGHEETNAFLKTFFPQVKFLQRKKLFLFSTIEEFSEELEDIQFFIDLERSFSSWWLIQIVIKRFRIPYYRIKEPKLKFYRWVMSNYFRKRKTHIRESKLKPKKLYYQRAGETLIKALYKILPEDLHTQIQETIFFPRVSQPISLNIRDDIQKKYPELEKGSWLFIHRGSKSLAKNLPEDSIKKVILEIVKKEESNINLQVAYFGQPLQDTFFKDKIKLVHLGEKISEENYYQYLKYARCVLTGDELIGGLAEGMNIPTYLLFGPTVEGFGLSTRMRLSSSFSSRVGCRPCSLDGSKACRYKDYLCYQEINYEQVASYILQSLSSEVFIKSKHE